MTDVTYYVAMPFLQDESGLPVAGTAEECQSSAIALRRAEILSRVAGHVGAVAFSRSGDPMMGEFRDARLLRTFGEVPEDLSEL
jgi:hypothetical protein